MRDPAATIAALLASGSRAVPGHSFRLAFGVMLSARHLEGEIDAGRSIELALAQGLGRFAEHAARDLDPDNALHLRGLLLELDNAGTSEARLVHAVDAMLEGREPVGRDPFLKALRRAFVEAGDLRAAG